MNRHTGVMVVDGLNRKTEVEEELPAPKTVLNAKVVDLTLVSYTNGDGKKVTQLALKGDNTLFLLDSKDFGVSKEHTPQTEAPAWLRDGVFKKLSKKDDKKED